MHDGLQQRSRAVSTFIGRCGVGGRNGVLLVGWSQPRCFGREEVVLTSACGGRDGEIAWVCW